MEKSIELTQSQIEVFKNGATKFIFPINQNKGCCIVVIIKILCFIYAQTIISSQSKGNPNSHQYIKYYYFHLNPFNQLKYYIIKNLKF